ncbi:hypothetical protein DSC47_19155 [Elizabethkingia miricola]|uniref:hypothetical protein n=1 Tax=Elizabethkingia bruuniana TaxID=1756149 RepID=UPI0005D9E7F5|nr:hypothetical protein [Elizabethkingia bruuniana]AJW64632.1 hypothetical protein VO54_03193 [Elizabethkingia miricola]OPC56261.1 hypothetical protein BAY07_08885 [Elizabethkingia bruuniana]OPC58098.1 hypothetical protein BAY13_13855 [Elizabethkingia bruuniana]RBI89354.1 hypothetical protein DSC47_19155 [Elizabethkingia miricola]
MENRNIIMIGKSVFGLSFLLGNICLFGYLFTKDYLFASSGYLLLIYASILNLLIVLSLLIYGLFNETKHKACLKSILILSINIPIAAFYALIGINLM